MGIFDFLKSKTNEPSLYVDGIGELTFSTKETPHSYRGKVKSISMGYPIEVVLPTIDRKISDYQKSYCQRLDKNLPNILKEASATLTSKLKIAECRVEVISVHDQEDDSYQCDAEIVVSQKERFGLSRVFLFSLIMTELTIAEIIDIG